MRVLVVEDEQKVANALREGLEGERYEVAVERTGEGAFFRLNTESFDVILLDLRLTDMTGFEVCERLKEDSRTAAVPLLVVTSQELSAADRLRLSNARSVLAKSTLTRETLRAAIQSMAVEIHSSSTKGGFQAA